MVTFKKSKCALLFIMLWPLLAVGYESVVAQPESARVVLPLQTEGTERFGILKSFPHTYEFTINEKRAFGASVFVHDSDAQKNDVSLIVVKQERRGVSEVGRTHAQESSWEAGYDALFAESFRKGGELHTELEPGIYTLEVSSPNNDGVYRLVVGNPQRGYLQNVQALFEIKKLVGSSAFSTVISPLLYIPFLLMLLCAGGYLIYRRVR